MAAGPGRPKGSANDKPWRDALLLAVKRKGPDGKVFLNKIAEQCVLAASNGDTQAIREVGDRLDGKPHQSVAMESNVTHSYVIRAPQPTKNPQEWASQYAPQIVQ